MLETLQKMWDLMKLVLGGVWKLINSGWSMFAGMIVFLSGLFDSVWNWWANLFQKIGVLYDIFTEHQVDLKTTMEAGFPTGVVTSVRFLGSYVPFDSMMAWTFVVIGVHLLCVFVRIIKAWIPTVN